MLDQEPLFIVCDLVWEEYKAERNRRRSRKWPVRYFWTKRERELFDAVDVLEKMWQDEYGGQIVELMSILNDNDE